MTGSTHPRRTVSHYLIVKAMQSMAMSQTSLSCGTQVPKRMRRSALVQIRDQGKKDRTLVKTSTVSCTALTMPVGLVRMRSSFASRSHLRRECENGAHASEC